MALKKTDYLVVDDRATGAGSAQAVQKPTSAPSGDSERGAGPFGEVLGQNPWAELSRPLKLSELESA